MRARPLLAFAGVVGLVLGACASQPAPSRTSVPAPSRAPSARPSSSRPASSPAPSATPDSGVTSVRLQLQWLPQAQFAGYFAAVAQGYYAAENLAVEIIPGGPDVAPQTVGSQSDGPEFTVAWVPKVLQAREHGSDLVDIAQVFQRSGTLSLSWVKDKITDPCQFAGKTVGVWGLGNEFEVTAAATACGLTPNLTASGDQATRYRKVIQSDGVDPLIAKDVDVAQAMIYNEYARILETTDPTTHALYQPSDLNVINYNDYRTAMLQDAIFARQSWLAAGNDRAVAVRFVRASLKGWIYCRDNPQDCVQYSVAAAADAGAGAAQGSPAPGASPVAGRSPAASGSPAVVDSPAPGSSPAAGAGTGHQAWMLNEINALIWPSPLGIGIVDPALWARTSTIAVGAGVLTAAPPPDAYDTSIATEALATLSDLDTTGVTFEKGDVTITVGGN